MSLKFHFLLAGRTRVGLTVSASDGVMLMIAEAQNRLRRRRQRPILHLHSPTFNYSLNTWNAIPLRWDVKHVLRV